MSSRDCLKPTDRGGTYHIHFAMFVTQALTEETRGVKLGTQKDPDSDFPNIHSISPRFSLYYNALRRPGLAVKKQDGEDCWMRPVREIFAVCMLVDASNLSQHDIARTLLMTGYLCVLLY